MKLIPLSKVSVWSTVALVMLQAAPMDGKPLDDQALLPATHLSDTKWNLTVCYGAFKCSGDCVSYTGAGPTGCQKLNQSYPQASMWTSDNDTLKPCSFNRPDAPCSGRSIPMGGEDCLPYTFFPGYFTVIPSSEVLCPSN